MDCADPERVGSFWQQAVGGSLDRRNPGEYKLLYSDGAPWLYFMAVPEEKSTKNRVHLDLVTDGSLDDEVGRLVDAGASVIEKRHDPDSYDNPDVWTVMVDPEGNEFCVTSTATITV